MTHKGVIFNRLQKNYLFAVVRGKSEQDGYKISQAAYEGGIKNIEVTFSTPGAERVINRLAEDFKDTEMVVGAGTVLDEVSARIAILNGAEFVVSPSFHPEIAEICNLYAIPYLPGCGSITEVKEALKAGCDVVKLFPGGLLGPSFIKDLHGPIPWVEAMPSGGVNVDNMGEWMSHGAWAVGVGSALTKGLTDGNYASVEAAAQKFADKLAALRG